MIDEVSPGFKKMATNVEQSTNQVSSGIDKVARAEKKAKEEAEALAKANKFLAEENEKAKQATDKLTVATSKTTEASKNAIPSIQQMAASIGIAGVAFLAAQKTFAAGISLVNESADAYEKLNRHLKDTGRLYDPIIDAQDKFNARVTAGKEVLGSYTSRLGRLVELLAQGVPLAAAFAQAGAEAATGRAYGASNLSSGVSGGWSGGPDYSKMQPPSAAELFNSYWHNKANAKPPATGGGGSSGPDPNYYNNLILGGGRPGMRGGPAGPPDSFMPIDVPVTDPWEENSKRMKAAYDRMQKYTDTLANGLTATFSGMLFDGMKLSDGLKGIFRGLVDDILGELSARAAKGIVTALIPGLGLASSGGASVQVGPAAMSTGLQTLSYERARGRG